MAEPYDNGATNEAATALTKTESGTSNTSGAPSSILACYACKRRKVKCNRELPTCSLCLKLQSACEYPTHPEKPGPKTGSLQRTKRRRLDGQSDSGGSVHDTSSFSAGRPGASFDPIRNTTTSPGGAHPHDASRPRVASTPDRVPGASPGSGASPSLTERTSHPTAPIFSRLMYPSHEAVTRPQSPSTVDTSPALQHRGAITVDSVCAGLKISRDTYDLLMDSYFTNMTSFSLFRPGSIEPKFALMHHQAEAETLVAAMFSFSARHCRDDAVDQATDCPNPSYFSHVALSQLDECVERYGDMRPPFWLLQAGILVTFYQLTLSVRSRSWKKLGDCIRYSYDLNLHIVDANHEPSSNTDRSNIDVQHWVLLEERRRAWWAVWEMDVFASTIRRLPTAIDQSLNLTLLPVPDSCWFNNIYQESCFLVEDCSLRWKALSESGNQSSKSWFIVMNSLMRNTQRIVYPAGSAIKSLSERDAETTHSELDIMANCLYCTAASLPASLLYQGQTLDFRPRSSSVSLDVNPRQEHADKYSIHLMTQLCRFMIYHHKICARAPWLSSAKGATSDQTPETAAQSNSEWSNYMSASDEIVLVVRNSSRDHYKYVNPFLANTLWFAAAAQCACKVFGPPSFNKRLTSSNLDLLKLTIDRFVSFWNGTENLNRKLARIEVGLKNLMANADGNGNGNGNGNGGGNGNGNGNPGQQPPVNIFSSPSQRQKQPLTTTTTTTTTTNNPNDSSSSGTHLSPNQNPSDATATVPHNNNFSMHGSSDPLLLGGMHHPWGDPGFGGVPDLSDFTQPFAMASGGFFSGDPMDVSPFGLEELLMNSMMQHM